MARHDRSRRGFYITLGAETQRLLSDALNSDEADSASENRDVNIDPGQSGPSNPGLPMSAPYSREVTFSLSRLGAERFCAEVRHPTPDSTGYYPSPANWMNDS